MSNQVKVSAKEKALVASAEKTAKKFHGYVIKDDAEFCDAGEHLKQIKTKAKQLNDLRLSMTRPLDASKRTIKAFFDKPLEALSVAENRIKGALQSYKEEKERKAEAEFNRAQKSLERRAENAEEKGNEEKADALRQTAAGLTVERPVAHVSGVKFRKVWDFQIINEKLLPREYLMPNEKAIRKAVVDAEGQIKIPGVGVFPRNEVAAGRA